MRNWTLILALVAIVAAGCASEEEVTPFKTQLIKEIVDPSCYKDRFTYENGQLSTYSRFFGDREDVSSKFSYSGEKLIRVERIMDGGLKSLYEIEYNENGQRSRELLTMTQNGATTYIRTGVFTYENGEPKSLQYTFDREEIKGKEMEFTWDNGNLIRIDHYMEVNGERGLALTKNYEYDGKMNFANQDMAFIYAIFPGDETIASRNNVVASRDVFPNSEVHTGGEFSFTYNDNRYPVGYTYNVAGQAFAPVSISYY